MKITNSASSSCLHILHDALVHTRPLDLHGDAPAIAQHLAMHLAEEALATGLVSNDWNAWKCFHRSR